MQPGSGLEVGPTPLLHQTEQLYSSKTQGLWHMGKSTDMHTFPLNHQVSLASLLSLKSPQERAVSYLEALHGQVQVTSISPETFCTKLYAESIELLVNNQNIK